MKLNFDQLANIKPVVRIIPNLFLYLSKLRAYAVTPESVRFYVLINCLN